MKHQGVMTSPGDLWITNLPDDSSVLRAKAGRYSFYLMERWHQDQNDDTVLGITIHRFKDNAWNSMLVWCTPYLDLNPAQQREAYHEWLQMFDKISAEPRATFFKGECLEYSPPPQMEDLIV